MTQLTRAEDEIIKLQYESAEAEMEAKQWKNEAHRLAKDRNALLAALKQNLEVFEMLGKLFNRKQNLDAPVMVTIAFIKLDTVAAIAAAEVM